MDKTYEMLWDCEFCDTKKLLGKTHRHCPECGATQNPEKRYFPSDSEKVAVEDHQFVGADRHCPACQAANSAITKFCTDCGSPMEEGQEVKGKTDAPKVKAVAPPPASSLNRKKVVIGGVVLLVIAGIAAVVLWKKEVALTVAAHQWERVIEIERFGPVTQSTWCDEMPRDASGITRTSEVRSHEKIPDGQTCSTKRVDNKDGTFREEQECKTKYKDKPIYDDKCRFTVNRWTVSRSVKREGKGLAAPPVWPDVNVPAEAAAVVGKERAGKRIGSYLVVFADAQNERFECSFDENKWRSFKDDSRWNGKIGTISGILDCDSLKAK